MSRTVLWVGANDAALQTVFAVEEYQVEFSATVADARRIVLRREPQFVAFSRLSHAGAQLIEGWRRAGRDIPILVGATPGTDEPERALACGATDYLLRPFTPDAALTRFKTHARRRDPPSQLTLSDRQVDLEARLVVGPDTPQTLTEIEARLLAFLGAEPEQAVRTETILRHVWGYGHALQTRAVANTVMRVRRKIEPDPKRPQHLLTVRGVGYRLMARTTANRALPTPPGPLVGRADLLARAAAALSQGNVLLHGPPGVGKSRLALTLAHTHPGDAIRFDLEGITDPTQLLQTIAVRLSLPVPAHANLSALGDLLAARSPMLLWFDGAEGVIAALLEAVAAWRAVRPRVLITTQIGAPMPHGAALRVDIMTPTDALALLADRALDAGAAAAALESPQALKLLDSLDRLPLAIVLAARRLPLMTCSQLIERTAALTTQAGLNRSLQVAWNPLTASARRLLWTAAQLPGAFGLETLEQVAHFDSTQDPWLPDIIMTLLRRSLLEQDLEADSSVRFRMLTCVRHWALQHPPPEPTRTHIEDGVVAHLLATCESAALGLGGRAPSRHLARLERLMPVMRSLSGHADARVRARAHLAHGEMLHFRGTLVGHLPSLLACLPSPDSALTNRIHLQAARFLIALGRFDEASAELDAIEAPELADAVWAERAEIGIGLGQFSNAADAAMHGAAITQNAFFLGRLLDLEATARHHMGEDASALQTQALAALNRAGATWYQAIVRHNLAFEALRTGQLPSALLGFESFARVARQVRSTLYSCMVDVNIGRVLIERGDAADAELLIRQSVIGSRENDFRRGEGLALSNLAFALIDQRKLVAAQQCLQDARIVAQAHDIGRVRVQAILWLGIVHHLCNELALAQSQYEAALADPVSDPERLPPILTEVRALMAIQTGAEVGPMTIDSKDVARSSWTQSLIGAAETRDGARMLSLRDDPVWARSFHARTLWSIAARGLGIEG